MEMREHDTALIADSLCLLKAGLRTIFLLKAVSEIMKELSSRRIAYIESK